MPFTQEEPWDEENCFLKVAKGGKSIVLAGLFDAELFDYSVNEVHTPRMDSACESSPKPSPTRPSSKTNVAELSADPNFWQLMKDKLGEQSELFTELTAKLGQPTDDAAQPNATTASSHQQHAAVAAVPTSWVAPPGATTQNRVIDDLEQTG